MIRSVMLFEELGENGAKEVLVGELTNLLKAKQIPDNARLDYAGCGSHDVAITWDDGTEPPPPPPPSAEEVAQELADRKAGF